MNTFPRDLVVLDLQVMKVLGGRDAPELQAYVLQLFVLLLGARPKPRLLSCDRSVCAMQM